MSAAPVTHRDAVIGGWLAASWDPRHFLPPYAQMFVQQLARCARRAYPGQDVIRRAPTLARPLHLQVER